MVSVLTENNVGCKSSVSVCGKGGLGETESGTEKKGDANLKI